MSVGPVDVSLLVSTDATVSLTPEESTCYAMKVSELWTDDYVRAYYDKNGTSLREREVRDNHKEHKDSKTKCEQTVHTPAKFLFDKTCKLE